MNNEACYKSMKKNQVIRIFIRFDDEYNYPKDIISFNRFCYTFYYDCIFKKANKKLISV